jgi:hypothetical protein
MAYSAVTFDIGAGEVGQTTFDLTFTGPGNGYLDQSHIYLYVNGVQRDVAGGTGPDGFDFITATQVELKNYSPVLGDEITFRRIVPKDALYVDFVDGAGLTEAMLDEQSLSNLYINHETQDGYGQGIQALVASASSSQEGAEDAEAAAMDAQASAEAAEASAVAAQESADLAQTAAEDAQADAEAAEAGALAAQADAEAAQALAEAAQAAAELAETGAETAEGNAQDWEALAQKWAEEVEDTEVEAGKYSALHWSAKASAATTAAETAQGLAEAAVTDAEAAQALAEAAQADAETAQADAETAQGLAEAAQSAAELAETNAETAETNAAAWEAKAELWAEEDEDVEVEVGQYSAYHWAQKALAAGGGGGLTAWEESGDDLVPVTKGNNIGSATAEVGHLYQETDGVHYFGDAQESLITHSGGDLYVRSTSGGVAVEAKSAGGSVVFRSGTTPTTRWYVDPTGHLLPGADGTYNIGSTTLGVYNTYRADNGSSFYGDAQESFIRYSSSGAFYIYNGTGQMWIGNTDNESLFFITNNTSRWYLQNSGHWLPGSAGVYNIGSANAEIQHLYHGDDCKAFYGADQDAEVYWDSANARLALEGMVRYVCLVPFSNDETVTTGDGTIGFVVPAELSGWEIVSVLASVYTAGSSGTTDIQVSRYTTTGTRSDCLTTKVTISSSQYSAADGVIASSGHVVYTGYQLFVDVDAVSTGTQGLGVVIGLQKV